MSADLLEAFGSESQSSAQEIPEVWSLNKTSWTENNPTEGYNIATPRPTQSRETALTQRYSSHAWPRSEHGIDVLFDADIYEAIDTARIENGDDEFGDFEQADVGYISTSSELNLAKTDAQTSSLIDLDNHETSLPSNNHSIISSTLPHTSIATTSTPQKSQLTILERKDLHTKHLIKDEDDWGQFEDVNSTDLTSAVIHDREKSMDSQSRSKSTEPLAASKSEQKFRSADRITIDQENVSDDGFNEDWDAFDEEKSTAPTMYAVHGEGNAQESIKASTRSQEVRGERPTNVPPPAILLTLFPRIFSLLCAQSEQTQNDDTGAQVMEAYRACARIIACRQLRWKRDIVLAQSMRIGAAGRSGGMKLTTLDKGEARREEQEAQEVISAWSRSSHKLNAIIVRAKLIKPSASLSTSLTARVVNGADILTSNHICPICGLKRNERINGIDTNLADIFGEFWIEFWGHKDCHEIWYTYSHLLDQR